MSGPLVANGIDALTGDPLLRPVAVETLAGWLRDGAARPTDRWLRRAGERIGQPLLGLPFDIEPTDLARARWGIVVSTAEPPATLAALEPLVAHRRARLGDAGVAILDHRPGEEVIVWLARHGVMPGAIVPHRVPFYLLLVGPPTRIPFAFQSLLDVEYAVGRIDLPDATAYAGYARSVVAVETAAAAPRDRSVAMVATRHPGDRATELSADRLVQPLARSLAPDGRIGSVAPVAVDRVIGEGATRAALLERLGGVAGHRPALVFSATHGLGWPAGHTAQRERQGAILCADWAGAGPAGPSTWVSGADLPADGRPLGMVAFLFACFGAGTPEVDAFAHGPGVTPSTLAPEPFVAALPRALLGHPAGGALAVIGHVERTWGSSFLLPGDTAAGDAFGDAVGTILVGRPVGLALRALNERFAIASTRLAGLLERAGFGVPVADEVLVGAWLERNDAGGFVLLGDPMATLRMAPP